GYRDSATNDDAILQAPGQPATGNGDVLPLAGAAPSVSQSAPAPVAVDGYEVYEGLGQGGMDVVYRARQLGLTRLVALKMILHAAYAGPDERRRFHSEAEAIARLRQPHIVQIYEVGEAGGLPYFSLEYCEGGSLEQKLDGTPWEAKPAAQLVET